MDLEVFTFPQKPTFLFKFSNFSGYTENAPNHILSSNSARQILKMAVKSEPVGLCSRNFWNFLLLVRPSKCKYFKDFKIFDLTWIWWIWPEWPNFSYNYSWSKCFTSTNKLQNLRADIKNNRQKKDKKISQHLKTQSQVWDNLGNWKHFENEMMKNAFHFTLKAPFILQIFQNFCLDFLVT